MKKIFHYILVVIVAAGLTLGSCKKSSTTETDDTAEQQQMAADEQTQHNESEASMNEANDAMYSTGVGKTSPIAGATIDSSSIAQKKLIVNYNGNNADGSRFRSGQIIVQLTNGTHWKDLGAIITVTYKAFKITRNATGKSLTFDGVVTITNVTGGKVFSDANVIHTAASNAFTITFDDGTTRNWNLSRKRTFTNTAGVLSIKTEGTGNSDGNANLLSWGQNRKGDNFYTQISSPIIFSTTCVGKPITGTKIHKGISREISVTFGLDDNGNTIAVGSACPTKFRINWTNAAGKSKEALLNY